MDPVATFDLPRAQIHGDGDDAVRWQGAFVSYGGHGADQSTTIVFEIEPGGRLGWHTDQTEETQYIVSGTGELHRDDGVFRGPGVSSCCRPTSGMIWSTPARRRCGGRLLLRRDVHADLRQRDAAVQQPRPGNAESRRVEASRDGERSNGHGDGCRGGGRDPQAGGGRLSDRVPGQSDHRSGSRGRYPDHHRPSGADRAAHGRRGQPRHLRGTDRGLRHAVRPGTENAFGGVAQAFGESVPIVVLPGGYPRTLAAVPPNFSAYLNFQHITKSAEQVTVAAAVPDALRRAFTQVKNGRPRPVLVEIPKDLFDEELPAPARVSAGAARSLGA